MKGLPIFIFFRNVIFCPKRQIFFQNAIFSKKSASHFSPKQKFHTGVKAFRKKIANGSPNLGFIAFLLATF
jgi:hypothetical protein